MKKLKQIITQLKSSESLTPEAYLDLLWPYICYSPKIPLRINQEQLLSTARTSLLKVNDTYFSKEDLHFPVYQWGNGEQIILLTHGWASKALDFSLFIEALKHHPQFTIIAFDAPGNGAAEGYLSNLILYIEAIKAIVLKHAAPAVTIGHSLGSMANIAALADLQLAPKLIVSLTPLVKLKENFAASMQAISVPADIQKLYFDRFEKKFNMKASIFDLNNLYQFKQEQAHHIIYDSEDDVAPYPYLKNFLAEFPTIQKTDFKAVGHHKVLKSVEINEFLIKQVLAATS